MADKGRVRSAKRRLIYRAVASPVTYARYDRTSAGSIYGMSQYGRLQGAKSPLPGLVVAGSATHGAGVEAAVISGACAATPLSQACWRGRQRRNRATCRALRCR